MIRNEFEREKYFCLLIKVKKVEKIFQIHLTIFFAMIKTKYTLLVRRNIVKHNK